MKTLATSIRASLVAAVAAGIPALAHAELPSWDKKIDTPKRFTVLKDFNDEAVLDNETGLVWERRPDPLSRGSWPYIDNECLANFTGKRLGWRPPAIEELLTLMAPLEPDKLPKGHPFELGADSRDVPRTFWTMSSKNIQPPNNDFAWVANFEPGGSLTPDVKISELHRFWCVRGGHGYDGNNVP
jgi:hypothetical protein